MKKILPLFSMMFFVVTVNGQKAEPAENVLSAACKQAAKSDKNVLVIFHASWCGWCHKMDSSILDKSCKRFFDENYVVVHLTVEESPNKKDLENPGAAELKKKYLGEKAGLPFWLMFDKDRKLLADSYIRKPGVTATQAGDNSGCPAAENEVDYFISVLRKTSRLTDSDLEIIAKRFRKNEGH